MQTIIPSPVTFLPIPKAQVRGTQTNLDAFSARLTIEYADLFANDPEYAYAASKCTPDALAHKIALGLDNGTANKDGEGVKRACKHFNIAHTYKAIRTFLKAQ